MYSVVQKDSPISKGEIRVEFETSDRVAITKYRSPKKDKEGNVEGYICLADVTEEAIRHEKNAKDLFFSKVSEIIGRRNFSITEDLIDALEELCG